MELYLKNIGKIADATIEVKGITVIGGENNTGKSTVGKSLFSVFNSFYEIQQQIREERLLSIENVLQLIYRNFYFYNSEQIKDIDDFAKEAVETDTFMFEKVIWLLLLGNLPTEKELEMFQEILESHRELPDGFAEKMIADK